MLLPLRLYLKIFRPSKQYVRLHPGLVLKEVSIQRRKTSQATGEQGTEQQVSSTETGGFWEDLEIGQDPTLRYKVGSVLQVVVWLAAA